MKRWGKSVSLVVVGCLIGSFAPLAQGNGATVIPQRDYAIIPRPPIETKPEPKPEPEPEESESGGGGGGGNGAVYIAVGAVAVVGVVWYVLWRRKKNKKQTTLYMDANLPVLEHRLNDSWSLTMDSPLRPRMDADAPFVHNPEPADLLTVQVALRMSF